MFIESAVENRDGTATLPIYRGTSRGRTVWYVVLDASTSGAADRYGVNRSNKLENAVGSRAVRRVRMVNGVIDFPSTVDFRPERVLVPGPTGFPPKRFQPGAVGEAGYTPLIQLPDGSVLNAPHLVNDSGRADRVKGLDLQRGRVRLEEVDGFANGRAVRYFSTESSDRLAAKLENNTYAPALGAAPFPLRDGSDSARATLVAFTNGQTGRSNPQRQGLSSAVLDGLSPLNVLDFTPNQGGYSPLWDVNLAEWTDEAIRRNRHLRQEDVSDIADLAEDRLITGPKGVRYGPSGFIVNCTIVSQVN